MIAPKNDVKHMTAHKRGGNAKATWSFMLKPKVVLTLAAIALLAAIAAVVWRILGKEKVEGDTSEYLKKDGLIREVAPSAATPFVGDEIQDATKAVKKERKIPPKPAFMTAKPRSEWDSREVALAYQWYALDPSNRVEGINMAERVPPSMFSNIVQETMAPFLLIGADVVPMGPVSDKEAWDAINTPIDFNFDDPDEVLEKKQGVKEMLEELKEFMEKGGHANEYFLRLESRQALEVEAMQEVRDQVRALERDGDPDGAAEALEVYNKYLEAKGLPRIHMRIRNLRKEEY